MQEAEMTNLNISHIKNTRPRNNPFHPIGVYFATDMVQLWRKGWVKGRDLHWLQRTVAENGGDVDIWPNDYTGRSARGVKRPFFRRYEQTLQIRQPPLSVLRWLAETDDGDWFNKVELAMELVFATEAENDIASDWID